MEILEIRMEHFGKFNGQTMRFHPGVNVIYGENETGKSTMRAFIRAMLYGLERAHGRASRTDEYTLRRPWENGAFFAGSMRFENGGRQYFLERRFSGEEKGVRLICETDGKEMEPDDGDLLALLDEMNSAAFDNTVFFGRPNAATDEELAAAVINEMISANPGGERIDAVGALDKLRAEKKRMEREKKQRMTEKIERLQEISTKIECARAEIAQLSDEEHTMRESLKEQETVRKRAWQELEPEPAKALYEAPTASIVWSAGKIVMALVAVAALAVGLLFTEWRIRAGAAAVILLSCVGVCFFGMHDRRQKEKLRATEQARREARIRSEYERAQRLQSRQRQMEPQLEKLRMNIEWTQNARKEKERRLQELEAQKENMCGADAKERQEEQKLLAAALAVDTLEETVAEIYRDYVKKLDAAASEILRELTDGRYTGVFLDEDFQVRVQTKDRLLFTWQVSRGTMEQIYFALRMACAQFLNTGDPLPLILDDAFLTYDDIRLEKTLRWLIRSGRQVLLFTCHRREQEILQKICQ